MTRTQSVQAPKGVVMIRPHHFAPNPATAADNAFQASDASRTAERLAGAAFEEASGVAPRGCSKPV